MQRSPESAHRTKRRCAVLGIGVLMLMTVLGIVIGQPQEDQEIAAEDRASNAPHVARSQPKVRGARAHDALLIDRPQGDPGSDRTVYYDPSWFRDAENTEWRRFRHMHPRLALGVEITFNWALRASAQWCAIKGAEPPDVSIFGLVTVQEREVLIEDVTCSPGGDAGALAAERFCDCLLAERSRDVHAVLPADTPDDGVRYYKGPLLIEHWGAWR